MNTTGAMMNETASHKQANRNERARKYRKLLFMVELSICCLSLIFGPVAYALQLEIQNDVEMRGLSQGSMDAFGVLKAYSTIDVPDAYKVMSHGQVDIQGTLNNWLRQSGYVHTRNPNLGGEDDTSDFFFPVHLVRASPGSQMTDLTGNRLDRQKEYYISLRHLAQDGALRVTNETKKFYPWNTTAPLESLDAEQAMAKSDGATVDCHCSTQSGALTGTASQDLTDAANALNESHGSGGLAPPAAGSNDSGPGFGNPLPAVTRACQNFIDQDGNYGPYGQIVLQEIHRYAVYDSPSNRLTAICPRFNDPGFNKDQFWVWVYASLAKQESGCNPYARAPARLNPNGVAVGLLQMELRSDLRRGRDIEYGGNYCEGNPFTPTVNIRCSARIMAQRLADGDGLYGRGSSQYWGPLEGSSRDITKRSIASYRDCF